MTLLRTSGAVIVLVALASASLPPTTEDCAADRDLQTDGLETDEVSMIQSRRMLLKESKESGLIVTEALAGRSVTTASESGKDAALTEIDCAKYPMFCHEKLNCRDHSAESQVSLLSKVATDKGRPNPQSWCVSYPLYAGLVQHCILNNDLMTAAKETFKVQRDQGLLEADGSYCFLAGHCNDTATTESTTAEQAERMCDQKYGRERWTSVSMQEVKQAWSSTIDLKKGYTNRRAAELGGELACAMGNFHCDVVYCKHMFCEDPYFRGKYGRLLFEDP